MTLFKYSIVGCFVAIYLSSKACSFNCHAPEREVDAGACRGMNICHQTYWNARLRRKTSSLILVEM